MSSRTSTTAHVLRNPIIGVLVGVLILLIGGFAGNYYLVNENIQQRVGYAEAVGDLKVLAQDIAKNAASAAQGNSSAFPILSASRSNFDSLIGQLKSGNPLKNIPPSTGRNLEQLNEIESTWSGTKEDIDRLLSNEAASSTLRETASDLSISTSAIQEENARIVAALLRASAPANQVALAQRQALLIERMSHSIDRVIQTGGNQSLVNNLTRDRQTFNQVLDGFINGDRDLLLTAATNADVQKSLARVEELMRSVSADINEVLALSTNTMSARQSAESIYAAVNDLDSTLTSLRGSYAQAGLGGFASPQVGLIFVAGALIVFLFITLLVYRAGLKSVAETEASNEQNQAAILQLLDELADLADGDLRVQATVTESFTGAIADSINFSIDQMRQLVSKINETSSKVFTVADETQMSAVELAEASQRQANEITDVTEAVNQMASSIDMVSSNAAESSSVAERSVDIANKGAVVVQNTIHGMDSIRGQIQETAKRIKRLGESSQEIGDIVALINDIADQTNILSLNAAIQASMAGDAGKGFAVVADEVQRLAERSGAAAKQISALVKTIQSDTNEAVTSMEQTTAEVVQGTRLAQDAGVALGEIESVSKSLAEIIENISDAARQQSASAGRISDTMKSIQEITSQTSDGTRKTAEAVGNLSKMTNELRSSVTSFKLPG